MAHNHDVILGVPFLRYVTIHGRHHRVYATDGCRDYRFLEHRTLIRGYKVFKGYVKRQILGFAPSLNLPEGRAHVCLIQLSRFSFITALLQARGAPRTRLASAVRVFQELDVKVQGFRTIHAVVALQPLQSGLFTPVSGALLLGGHAIITELPFEMGPLRKRCKAPLTANDGLTLLLIQGLLSVVMSIVTSITPNLRCIIGFDWESHHTPTVNAGQYGICFSLWFTLVGHVFSLFSGKTKFSGFFLAQK